MCARGIAIYWNNKIELFKYSPNCDITTVRFVDIDVIVNAGVNIDENRNRL